MGRVGREGMVEGMEGERIENMLGGRRRRNRRERVLCSCVYVTCVIWRGALFKERESCVCSDERWAVRVGGKGIGQEGASWRGGRSAGGVANVRARS